MRNGALTFVLLVSLSCSLAGALLVYLQPDAAAAFAYLLLNLFRDAAKSVEVKGLAQPSQDTIFSLVDFNRESIFYGFLSVCATLLMLRTCSAILSIIRKEGSIRLLGMDHDASGREPRALRDRCNQGRSWLWDLTEYVLNRGSADPGSMSKPTGFRGSILTTALGRFIALDYGLVGKLIFVFTGAIALFGIVTIALVHSMLLPSLKRQAIERAKVTALDVAALANLSLSKKKLGVLNELLRKKASAAGLAYILIEDEAGAVVAHSFDGMSKQLSTPNLPYGLPNGTDSTIQLGDALVYEARFPIGKGGVPGVRVGVWKNDVDAELGRVVSPIIKFVVIVVIAEMFLAVLLIWHFTRPILRLVGSARRISIGELDIVSPGVEENSELGELSRALERMRSSVKAAMSRL